MFGTACNSSNELSDETYVSEIDANDITKAIREVQRLVLSIAAKRYLKNEGSKILLT